MESSKATEVKTVRQIIQEFLAKQTSPLTPLTIAKETGLNRHTVRRELQAMFKAKLIAKDPSNHTYVPGQPTEKKARSPIRSALRMLVEEYAKTDKYYEHYAEPDAQRCMIESAIREIKKGEVRSPYGVGKVRRLAANVFGRREHGKLVAYSKQLPDWFVEFARTVELDDGLKCVPTEEFDRVEGSDRREGILAHLRQDPYLLGDIRDFVRNGRRVEMLNKLKQLGMTEEDVHKFVAEVEPKALKTVYQYWLDGMDWYRRLLTRDIMDAERNLRRGKDDIEHLMRWVGHARQAYRDLKAQGKALNIEAPAMPWIDKYEERIHEIAGLKPVARHARTAADGDIRVIELAEPLPEAPVTIRVRKRMPGANPGKHIKMTYGEARPLIEKEQAKILEANLPAPSTHRYGDSYGHTNIQPGKWHVIGRWREFDAALEFLSDEHHADFLDSDYWKFKKDEAKFAILHWQGEYWPAVMAGLRRTAPIAPTVK